MKFKDMIEGIEKARGEPLTEREMLLFAKIWNSIVECIADEWSVLREMILKMKISKSEMQGKPSKPLK